jgi:type VI secretion system protein ImpI
MEREFSGGQLVIGRGEDADWRLNDPDMYVSRRHAILSEEGGRVVVTDASSGGLYVDNAAKPVGAGNSVALEPGMRLRMGDFVVRVESIGAGAAQAQTASEPASGRSGGMAFSFDFGPADTATPEPPKRPDTLPDPFGARPAAPAGRSEPERRAPPRPLDQEDPFALDLRGAFETSGGAGGRDSTARDAGEGYFGGAPSSTSGDDARERVRDPFAGGIGGPAPSTPAEITPSPTATPEEPGDVFGLGEPPRERARDPFGERPPSEEPQPTPPRTTGIGPDIFGGPASEPAPAPSPPPEPPAFSPPPAEPPRPAPSQPEPPRQAAAGAPPPKAEATEPPGPAPHDDALRAAFYRGLGLDAAEFPAADTEAEMEAAGRRMRALIEGLMHMLRARAAEKSRARVAQTLISSADVNPLKFLVTPEDAAAALMHPRGHGYLEPDAAIAWAFRDLADHQMRTWTALQTSLRRMIDRFDPAEIEREMEDTGLMERLIAGGRSAKLWQLYTERYGEIAKAAEEQFLGEVGPDFREAYESKGSP